MKEQKCKFVFDKEWRNMFVRRERTMVRTRQTLLIFRWHFLQKFVIPSLSVSFTKPLSPFGLSLVLSITIFRNETIDFKNKCLCAISVYNNNIYTWLPMLSWSPKAWELRCNQNCSRLCWLIAFIVVMDKLLAVFDVVLLVVVAVDEVDTLLEDVDSDDDKSVCWGCCSSEEMRVSGQSSRLRVTFLVMSRSTRGGEIERQP